MGMALKILRSVARCNLLIHRAGACRKPKEQEICICNRMGLRQLRINFTSIFKVFTKLPESPSDEGNLENFENTGEINS